MLNILFWNLMKNSIENYITECIVNNEINIAVLTEYEGINFKKLINNLGGFYTLHQGINANNSKIVMLARNNIEVRVSQELPRYVIYRIKTSLEKYIIVGIHLEDRRNYKPQDRLETIKTVVSDLEKIEEKIQCKNTIVIGDFNANPYDEEIISFYGFNAVLFKDVIKDNETRNWNFHSKQRFYNPILHYISEDTNMYGSFYYVDGGCTSVWHCLDQVLLRRQLIDSINDIKYLKETGNTDLIANIRPNKRISDHLPLFVSIL